MKENQMRLIDAGVREHAWARQLIEEKKTPPQVSYENLLSHGVYDASTDRIILTVKGVDYSWKVNRP